jgi:hypothetical protein
MTRMDKLARNAAIAAKRLENARELLSEMRHAHNEAMRLLCQAWDARMGRRNV